MIKERKYMYDDSILRHYTPAPGETDEAFRERIRRHRDARRATMSAEDIALSEKMQKGTLTKEDVEQLII